MAESSAQRTTMIASMLNICNKATIDMGSSVRDAVISIMVICLKFIDRKVLYAHLLGERFIDWDYIDSAQLPKHRNFFGDASTWLQLCSFLQFAKLSVPESVLQRDHPPLWTVYSTVRSSGFLDMKGLPVQQPDKFNFDDVCKLFILLNIEGLASKHVTDLYTTHRLNRNTEVLTTNIMAALADNRITPESYLATMKFLFANLTVNEAELSQFIAHYRQSQSSQREVW